MCSTSELPINRGMLNCVTELLGMVLQNFRRLRLSNQSFFKSLTRRSNQSFFKSAWLKLNEWAKEWEVKSKRYQCSKAFFFFSSVLTCNLAIVASMCLEETVLAITPTPHHLNPHPDLSNPARLAVRHHKLGERKKVTLISLGKWTHNEVKRRKHHNEDHWRGRSYTFSRTRQIDRWH